MITASISQKDSLITDIADGTGKSMVICSSKVESPYLSPRQLVQAALAGCLSMTIRKELTENHLLYDNVTVKVDMSEPEGKTVYTYQVEIESDDPDQAMIESVKEKAVKDCYIRGLLSEGIQIVEGEIEDADEPEIFRCCD